MPCLGDLLMQKGCTNFMIMFSCVSADLLRVVDAAELEDADRNFAARIPPPEQTHVRRLLEAIHNSQDSLEDINAGLVHAAARIGNVDELKLLLEKGADVNCVDSFGRTPLMDAAWEGKAGAVKLLLEYGADTEVENHGGGTALKVAMRRRHPAGSEQQSGGDEVVRILREHRETLRRKSGNEERHKDHKWHRDPDWTWHAPQQEQVAEF